MSEEWPQRAVYALNPKHVRLKPMQEMSPFSKTPWVHEPGGAYCYLALPVGERRKMGVLRNVTGSDNGCGSP